MGQQRSSPSCLERACRPSGPERLLGLFERPIPILLERHGFQKISRVLEVHGFGLTCADMPSRPD
ncbi:hypothetical protein HNQ08_001023 [Deinococcus humi]|uniref:Uncharacterized protein n=1 Tax=Deinococcus humi TaxID=662880 RepID=A0A7W8JU14_9DEIO|nr:hypothetical protein [Deinococcus humi]